MLENNTHISKVDYLLYAYKQKYHLIYKWYLEIFAIQFDDVEYEYITIKNGVKYLRVEGKLLECNVDKYSPILDITDIVKINVGDIENLNETLYTSIGIFIANALFLVFPFGNKIPYKNGYFTHKEIEKTLPNFLKENIITVEEYRNYVDSVSFSLNINKLFSYSNTKKTITAAPGIEKFKNDLITTYFKKYGPDWKDDGALALQFIDELKKYDLEYIKDDPSFGKLLSGKILNNTRPRMFMAFGVESGFDSEGNDSKFIINSLLEGYPKDKTELATMFNAARKGSYDRGAETQQAGAMVKEMQRASSGLEIKEGDCGTTDGITIFVNETNLSMYKDVYVITNGKSEFKKDLSEYKNKKVKIRTTMYCGYKDFYCEICAGKELLNYKKGISLLIISSAGVILNLKMKGMHKASKQLMTFNILNTIR